MTFLKIDDVKIHFEQDGRGSFVVFLPGLSLDGGFFGPLVRSLASEVTSVLVDIRGAGLSDAPRGPYSIELLARDIDQLARTLHLENAMVVGHSMGGFIAMELALMGVPWLSSMMIISSSPVGHPEKLQASPRAARAMRQKRGPYREIIREITFVGVGRRVREKKPAVITEFIEQRIARPPCGAGFTGQSAAAALFDKRGALRAVRIPCSVIHGMDDEIVSYLRSVELAREIKGSKLVLLEEIGHFPPVEAPDAVAEEILHLAKRSADP